MATISITSLGLGNADLTAIGKLSETGLSQVEVADAVVEGDKLKKGNKIVAYDGHLASISNPHNTTAGQVGAYTKAEVDTIIDNIPETDLSGYYTKTETYNKTEVYNLIDSIPTTDLSGYYNKTEVDNLIDSILTTDLSDYYTKTEVYNKLESYSKAEVDSLISGGGADLSDYYTKTEVDSLIPDISTKQDVLVSGTSIKTINGESVLGSGDLVISGGGTIDLSDYYKKTETYSKVETDSLVDAKQDTLVSGTSIKTINGQSVLGNGNILISAEADLSNYYTKPQVDGLINEIYEEIVSIAPLGEYGLRWNQETDVYEALGATNRTQIQRNMRRCVLNDDGTVNYYLDPNNSTLKEDGTPANLIGADGNVMVQVPKFWYKHTLVGDTHEWWVSNTPLEGYSIHPWFLEGGVERDYRYYRAYTCTNVSGKLRSISGATPTRSQTRNTFRTQARANGAGWGLCSWNAVNAIQLLFLTEYCTFNTQAKIGTGNNSGSDYGITTGQSNTIGNASSGIVVADTWMSYRGIENWYADCWEFIDGINVQNYKVYLNQNPATFADDVFTGDYVDSGVTLPAMSGFYIQKISGNFLPTAVGGSSSSFITDGGWSSSGGTLVIFGGYANYTFISGGFTFGSHISSSYSGTDISAGLSR